MSALLPFAERAAALFDDAHFESVALPMPPGAPQRAPRLQVVRGQVQGRPVLAYGNLREHKGGAVGVIEAAWMAAATLLAWHLGMPAVALHDGVGADIHEGSTALDWSAAYLGALAIVATGDDVRIEQWLNTHPAAPYFRTVLAGDETMRPRDCSTSVTHCYLGRSVGMQSLAGAVAGRSFLVERPETYRVLLAAPVVQLMHVERSSNRELSQAAQHCNRALPFVDEPALFATLRETVQEQGVVPAVRELPEVIESPALQCGIETHSDQSVGVMRDCGVQDVAAVQAAIAWHRYCVVRQIPLHHYSDSPGLAVGVEAERAGIQYWSGVLIRELAQSTLPCTVTIAGESYGGRYIQSSNPMLGGVKTMQATPEARLGVLPEHIAQQLFSGR